MTATIQTSSLTNSVTMTLNMELRQLTGVAAGFGDTQRIVRDHARQIVEDFTGSLLARFIDPAGKLPSGGKTISEKLTHRIIRDLHRQTGTTGRVDVDTAIAKRIAGLVAAFQGDWPHRDAKGNALDEAGKPLGGE